MCMAAVNGIRLSVLSTRSVQCEVESVSSLHFPSRWHPSDREYSPTRRPRPRCCLDGSLPLPPESRLRRIRCLQWLLHMNRSPVRRGLEEGGHRHRSTHPECGGRTGAPMRPGLLRQYLGLKALCAQCHGIYRRTQLADHHERPQLPHRL